MEWNRNRLYQVLGLTLLCVWLVATFSGRCVNARDTGNVNTFGQLTEEERNAYVDKVLDSMTLRQKVCQMFIATPEALTGMDVVTQAGDITAEQLSACPIGGIIYFKKNLINPSQTVNMLSDVQYMAYETEKLPLFLCVDEEGGKVARIGSQNAFDVPKIKNMADVQTEEEAYQAGNTIGEYLAGLGFNFDFAPDADVLTNPENGVIGVRSFGEDPEQVTLLATAVAKGLQEHQIMSTFKHFPGHGATLGDTHEGFAYTDKTYEELLQQELVPFQAAQSNGIDAVMVAHISVPNVTGDDMPSSLSYRVITEILKEDLGYEGLIVTDALNMGAITNRYDSASVAVLAVQAGNDLLLMPENLEEAVNSVQLAVETGQISEERIDASVRKIILKKLSLME